MIDVILDRRSVLGVLGAVMLIVLAYAAPASAATPWWHVNSGSRPSTLTPGLAKDEVEEVTVSATSGSFELEEIEESGNENESKIATLPYDATAAEVREGVEQQVYTGGREVEVTEGAGDTSSMHSWIVTFRDQMLKPMLPRSSGLVGAGASANVKEISHGRPDGQIVVSAENLGDASLTGASPLSIHDTLPAGLRAVAIEATAPNSEGDIFFPQLFECSYKSLACSASVKVAPYRVVTALVSVAVEPSAKRGESNEASVSGGGVASASVKAPVAFSAEQAPFGVESFEMLPEEAGGAADTQAGSHPFQLTTLIGLNQAITSAPVATAKDLNVNLPPGLIGNPTAFPQCNLSQFNTNPVGSVETECPPQTAVGVAAVYIDLPFETSHVNEPQFAVPLFNLEPSRGEPARFGFMVERTPVYLDTAIRAGSDYGVTVKVSNISEQVGFLASRVTFWGVPGDPRHDNMRGSGCVLDTTSESKFYPCAASAEQHPPPLLSLPTSCTGEMQSTIDGDSWLAPSEHRLAETTVPALDGCNRLPFDPSITVTPDGTAASSATGLNVDVHVPQEASLNADGLAESYPREITVALPPGVAVNPASGDGLEACSEEQVGYLQPPASEPPERLYFTGYLAEPFCPNASKIGEATIKTPLLPNPIKGFVYLAAQNANPFGGLVAIYLVAEDPVSGVLIKLAGETHLTESGQIVTTFKNSPQAPFEDAELHFFGGERAPLSTPSRCGPYTTHATISGWAGNPASTPESTFDITSGPDGSPCPGATLPFSPSLEAGTTNINAGGFSPLTTTIGREDGNQDMQSVELHMPAGLEGILSGVKLCPEAQANEGTCGPESQIGETIVSAGVGSDPVSVTGGRVYITENYAGAPFGLSIVNPVKAGPFDLEHDTANPNNQPLCDCVVVRAKIEIDPHTAALKITTDPSGAHAIPHLIDGIPVQIKKVNVTINRPGFTLNPTNCNPMSVTGAIASDEEGSSPVSVPFQVTNCAVLKFQPKFTAGTSGQTSKADGASLKVKVAYPSGSLGTQASIKSVKVELPKALPSRLTTLQRACTAKAFETNPASCPPESIVGHAIVHTQLLPVLLEGPAYFVSHGGEAFPNLIMVLQGYGVTVELVGDTFISKAGITSSTFATVPDVPFENFELTLPEGKYSALAANGNLCQQQLVMPTAFTAQNGAVLNQSTSIEVEGCSNSLSVISKRVTKRTLKLSVAVPSGGKLTAAGVGLSKATKSAKGREAIAMTLKVKRTKTQAALLAHHHGRKLVDHVTLTFRLANGKKLKKTFSVVV